VCSSDLAKSRDDITALMGRPDANYTALLGVFINDDAKAPDRYAVYAATGGLGLQRDYYLEAKFADKKAAYEVYIARMLTLIGWARREAVIGSDRDVELLFPVRVHVAEVQRVRAVFVLHPAFIGRFKRLTRRIRETCLRADGRGGHDCHNDEGRDRTSRPPEP